MIVRADQVGPVQAAQADLDAIGRTDSCIDSVLPQAAQKPRSASLEERYRLGSPLVQAKAPAGKWTKVMKAAPELRRHVPQ